MGLGTRGSRCGARGIHRAFGAGRGCAGAEACGAEDRPGKVAQPLASALQLLPCVGGSAAPGNGAATSSQSVTYLMFRGRVTRTRAVWGSAQGLRKQEPPPRGRGPEARRVLQLLRAGTTQEHHGRQPDAIPMGLIARHTTAGFPPGRMCWIKSPPAAGNERAATAKERCAVQVSRQTQVGRQAQRPLARTHSPPPKRPVQPLGSD